MSLVGVVVEMHLAFWMEASRFASEVATRPNLDVVLKKKLLYASSMLTLPVVFLQEKNPNRVFCFSLAILSASYQVMDSLGIVALDSSAFFARSFDRQKKNCFAVSFDPAIGLPSVSPNLLPDPQNDSVLLCRPRQPSFSPAPAKHPVSAHSAHSPAPDSYPRRSHTSGIAASPLLGHVNCYSSSCQSCRSC